jgi:lipase chaperone LimK
MTPAEKLGLVNSLMADARETWKQTYQQFHSESRSVEALAEAVARERYFQVKRITQQLLRDALVLATSAW